MEQPHFHFSFSKWEGMWWRGEKNFLCIFIQDVVCVKPCPTPWTWAAWLAFREFIKTRSLVYGNMGILDGGEVEFSPLGNLLQRKTPHPPQTWRSPRPYSATDLMDQRHTANAEEGDCLKIFICTRSVVSSIRKMCTNSAWEKGMTKR